MVLQAASWLRPVVLASACLILVSLVGAYYVFVGISDQAQKHPGRGQNYVSFDVAPAGEELVFSAQGKTSSNLFTLALTNSKVSAVTSDPAFDQQPAFSPDGKQIVFAASDIGDGIAHIFICPFSF